MVTRFNRGQGVYVQGGGGNQVTYSFAADTQAYQRPVYAAEQATKSFVRSAREVGKELPKIFAVAGALSVAHVTQMVNSNIMELRRFEDELANINKLMDFSSSINAVRDSIRELSVESGRGLNEIAAGYESVFSVGLGAQADAIVESADRLGKSIDVELGTATRLITANMNAFGFAIEEVDDVMDVMSGTIDVAAFSGEAYSRVMGRMVGTAAATEVSLESMNAVWATLTTSGLEAGEAASGFSQLVLQLARETTEAGKAFKEATGETFVEFMRRTGGDLPAALRVLNEHMAETGRTTTQVFGAEVRAITAFSLLSTEEGVRNLDSAVKDLNDSMGLTEENALLAEQSLGHLARVAENETQRALDSFGEDLLGLSNWLKGISAPGLEQTGGLATTGLVAAGAGLGAFIGPGGVLAGAGIGAGIGLLSSIGIGSLINWVQAFGEADESAKQFLETLTDIEKVQFDPQFIMGGQDGREIVNQLFSVLRILNHLEEEYNRLEDAEDRVAVRMRAQELLDENQIASKEELVLTLGLLIPHIKEGSDTWKIYGDEIREVTIATGQLYEWNEELHLAHLRNIDGGTKYAEAMDGVNQVMVEQLELLDDIVGKDRTNWDELLNDQAALTQEWLNAYEAANQYLGVQDAILFNEIVSWENAERLALMRAPEIQNWTEDDRNAYIGEVLEEMRTGERQVVTDRSSAARGTGTPASVRPRVTPGEILNWSRELAREWVTEKGQTDISWDVIEPLIRSRIADDQRIRDQFGFERYGMSEARVSDFAQGAWQFSGAADVFRAAVDKFYEDNKTYAQLMSEYMKQQKEESAQFHKDLMDSVYGGNETNKQWFNRRIGIVNDRGEIISSEAQRLFNLARGAMDDEALSRLDLEDYFQRATFSTGFFGGRGMEDHTFRTFQRIWEEWFKQYRDAAIISDMFGAGTGSSLGGFLGGAGFGAFGRSSASLSFGELGAYVRQLECDAAKAAEDQTAVLMQIERNTSNGLNNNFYGVTNAQDIAREMEVNARMVRF